MTDLIGTLHKPPYPEVVPDPEEIYRATSLILNDPLLHKVVMWMNACARASERTSFTPKVPVEAMRDVLSAAKFAPLGVGQRTLDAVESWLSTQEEGDK